MIKLYTPHYPDFIMDVLRKATSFIPYKDISINVTRIENYDKVKGKNINLWVFEPIRPNYKRHDRRRMMFERAINDSRVANIFCFDKKQTKAYNIDKVKYWPFGYIDQLVCEGRPKNGICHLGNVNNHDRRKRMLQNLNVEIIETKSYKSLDDTTNRIAKCQYGIDTQTVDVYVNHYINCLKVSQYVMARTVVISDNIFDDFGIKSYIYTKVMNNTIFSKDPEKLSSCALDELKENVNMKDIFLQYSP